MASSSPVRPFIVVLYHFFDGMQEGIKCSVVQLHLPLREEGSLLRVCGLSSEEAGVASLLF